MTKVLGKKVMQCSNGGLFVRLQELLQAGQEIRCEVCAQMLAEGGASADSLKRALASYAQQAAEAGALVPAVEQVVLLRNLDVL